MRIAHIVSTYPPYHGGMGNVAAAMHEELLKRGHESFVITPRHGNVVDQAGIIRLKPFLRFRNSAFIPQIGKYLDGMDIIHLHYPFYGGAEAVTLWKRRHPQTKLVMSYHMDTVGQGVLGSFFTLYQKIIQPKILRVVDVVTASSRDYAHHSQLALYPEVRFEELPFGVSDEFQPGAKEKSDSLKALFVGGLDKAHYFKGLSVLIEALSLCKQPVYLNIVGSGDLLPTYQEQARKLGVLDRIVFKGAVNKSELIQAYQQADVTILPSIDRSEAFGLVLLESMACQTPVIASDLPGVRTLARHGQTGLVVPPKNPLQLAAALDTIASDVQNRLTLGLQAHHLVEQHYRWPRIIDRLESIYNNL